MDFSTKVYLFLLILVTSFSSTFQVAFDSGAYPMPMTPKPAPKERLITIPPIIEKLPITLPPNIEKRRIGNPAITLNPSINFPLMTGKSGSSLLFAPKNTCPLDIVKFGTCLDLLSSVIQIGDPTLNECCPLIKGLTQIEATTCLCTAIKLKFLNIYMLYPIVVDLTISCGKTLPPA